MEAGQREWKKDWTKEVWNVAWADEQFQTIGCNLSALWVADSPDSKYEMVTVTMANTPEIGIWSAEFYQKTSELKDEFYPTSFDLVGNTGKAVLAGAYTAAHYSVWDFEKGQRLRKYERTDPNFDSVVIRENSILLGTYATGISQFDLETGRPGKKIDTTCKEGTSLLKDPTRPSVVYVGDKQKSTIAMYDLRSGSATPSKSLLGLSGPLASMNMRFYGHENTLVAATGTKVCVFDVSSGRPIHTITHLPEYRAYRQVDIVKDYLVVAMDYEGLAFFNIAGGDVKEPEYSLGWSGLQAYQLAATPDAIFVNYVTSLRRALLP